eukprot:9636156-Heterocapsa_arctica.AAC.1
MAVTRRNAARSTTAVLLSAATRRANPPRNMGCTSSTRWRAMPPQRSSRRHSPSSTSWTAVVSSRRST